MDQLSSLGATRLRAPDRGGILHRLVREPLVHFLLLGLLLFVGYDLVGGHRGEQGRHIVIDDGVVADIVQRYAMTWQRAPTPTEMRALLDTYVEDEILYREGVAEGLVNDDPVIRRRVRQKMDVIAEENAQSNPPTDADLEGWLKTHADQYGAPPVLSFAQVMFDPTKLGAGTEAAMLNARARLAAGADPATMGEVTLLPRTVDHQPLDSISRDFGEDFTDTVARLPVGSWQGPIRSGYGLHLVRVTLHQAGHPAALADVRKQVESDWENDRRERTAKAYYDNVRRDFTVQVTAKLPPAAIPANMTQ